MLRYLIILSAFIFTVSCSKEKNYSITEISGKSVYQNKNIPSNEKLEVKFEKLFEINNDSLKELFATYGEVTEAVVIMDRETQKSKGFGFVTFSTPESAQKALEMSGKEVDGRAIVVNIAKPREERRSF